MADETDDVTSESSEEAVSKPRFKIEKPNPIVYFIAGPFVLIILVYIVLSSLLISSDMPHEAKLEKVMAITNKDETPTEQSINDGSGKPSDVAQDEAGFLDIHNYFEFPVAFAVNIPDTSNNLTFELAVSTSADVVLF